MNIQTSELRGDALNYVVALLLYGKANVNINPTVKRKGVWVHGGDGRWRHYFPETNWLQAGKIVESYVCTLIKRDNEWQAEVFGNDRFCYSVKATNPRWAALRTFVASRLGPTVSVPEELA